MPVTLDDLRTWMLDEEAEHLEFKEAKGDFKFDKLRDYCAAFANEGGGRLVLGVTDRRPRRVVGSRAFLGLQKTKADLLQQLHIRTEVYELAHEDGRVLVFDVPSHPLGILVHSDAKLQMRGGEGLIPMSPDMQRRILNEAVQDYSAELCVGADFGSLDSAAIETLRSRWHRKSSRADLLTKDVEQLLTDAELIAPVGVTIAAVVLLGTAQAVVRFLPQAEVVFEYRSGDATGPAQDRKEYTRGFFLYDDKLWSAINLRNDKQHYQDGLFIWDIPTFSEDAVREAVLNAVSHRDYRLGGSVFVRQYPRRLEVISPGGFPEGVNPDNILWQQSPRNRRIADVLKKCGMVERSGQGANVMFESSIRESKSVPDYTKSDDTQVFLTLDGTVQDVRFLRFLERAAKETQFSFSTEDLLVLNGLRTSDHVSERLATRIPALREAGLVEAVSRGKGTRYLLSKKLYIQLGEAATYTRRRGLDRETNKELLLKHLRDFGKGGVQLNQLCRVVPSLSYDQVRSLLRELQAEGKVHPTGRTRAGRWHPGRTEPNSTASGEKQRPMG
jgi:ATP-dependent DNA helicase RecG